MRLLLCATILIAFLATSIHAAASVGKFSDPKHPGKCVIDGNVMSPGEKLQPSGTCAELVCHDEEGNGSITDCGVIGAPPNCRVADFDTSKPHPSCCQRDIICD
ncbi:uncharacterized protein LOC119670865 [Teleopsis dalmanni]|uniref:uncharacterized protein LOC119670865 n=1 Tax=Teleopsis dalmanni TaxID=139649 RepID=UPI0018CDD15C|nr:uncharacterized protein LOC119670865 [Teleopsis dalmanni]